MCGIIAYLGHDTTLHLIEGLKQLQNRGYDSAGISTFQSDNFVISKYASIKKVNAIEKLEENLGKHTNATCGIAHTRWATHGAKTDDNSHPHMSSDGLFTLVHNGIIENYSSLKKMLLENGFTFKSQTDTEVIVNLIAYNYKSCQNIKTAIKISSRMMEGTWGLAIMCKLTPNTIYCTRQGSPILISENENCVYIASEQSGFCGNVSNYFVLKNDDLCIMELKDKKVNVTTEESYILKLANINTNELTPDPYPHWTIKEINEQVESSLRAISLGGRLLDNNKVRLGGLDKCKEDLIKIDNLILLGCGTSYHAGMVGMVYLKDLCNFSTVQLFDGAEFGVNDIPKKGKTALLLLSQSGETKDLHRCIEIGKSNDLFLMGVVNVVDSLIAREVHCGCYLNAGREVAVASTKAFTSQVIILSMIAVWFSQEKKINKNKRMQFIKDLRSLHKDIKSTIEKSEKNMEEIVSLFSFPSCFILGKGIGESIAREAALKIKEISYIHAEGYSTSSLKHGPFALLEENFPVILIAPDNVYYSKSENAYEEIKSRHANIIYISDKYDSTKENLMQVSYNESFQNFLCIIPLQLLAYRLSLSRGLNPDMPRNLAKVVTVE
jgi:glucosamine--fructose-6-phosphate aminotransferase (isomerizing)